MSKPIEHPDFCWSHHIVERKGTIRCGECLHWYPDGATLVKEFNEAMWAVGLDYVEVREPDEVFFCAHCAHDF